MKKYLLSYLCLACLILSVGFTACDTKPQDTPPEPPKQTGLKKEDITFKWKLAAGKVTAPLSIADIYDPANFTNFPQLAATACSKNSVLELKADNTFSESSACYTGTAPAPSNPQAGIYTFSEAETSFTISYTNASSFPSILLGRTLKVKSIDKTATPHKMIAEFVTVQGSLTITTEFTFEKMP